jgi:hypothetical protein
VYTLFASYSSSYPFSYHLPSPWTEPVLPSCSLIFRRKNIKDKKKSMAFLLVWDKDCYTESFLVLFPWICVTIPVDSSLLVFFTPLPMVAPPV